MSYQPTTRDRIGVAILNTLARPLTSRAYRAACARTMTTPAWGVFSAEGELRRVQMHDAFELGTLEDGEYVQVVYVPGRSS